MHALAGASYSVCVAVLGLINNRNSAALSPDLTASSQVRLHSQLAPHRLFGDGTGHGPEVWMGVGWHVHGNAVRQAITCTFVNEFWASCRKCGEMTVLCAPYVRGSFDLAFSMAGKKMRTQCMSDLTIRLPYNKSVSRHSG